MAKAYTSTLLINSVKNRAMIPETQNTFSDANFLNFANEEISLGMLPSVLRLHEDYFLYTEEVDLIPGVSDYQMPYRAIGDKLRDVAFKDNNNNIYEMTRINVDDVSQYNGPYTTNRVHAFYINNNAVTIQPKITGSMVGKLVFTYYIRPNEMVTEDRAAIIRSINTTTGEITVNQIPAAFTVADTNTLLTPKLDIIRAKTPFSHLAIDQTPLSFDQANKIITFDPASIPLTLAVGDYINIAEECIVPQIPLDLHVVLAHRVAARCLEALGDAQGLQAANQKLEEMEITTTNLIGNRVEAAPRKVVNRHSNLHLGLYRRRYRFRG
jgi:hypothetical protein